MVSWEVRLSLVKVSWVRSVVSFCAELVTSSELLGVGVD